MGVREVIAIAAAAFAILAAAAVEPFGMSDDFLAQIALERQMFSVNTIDGAWGAKSKAALAAWLAANSLAAPTNRRELVALLLSREGGSVPPYRLVRVTEADRKALVAIPSNPAEKMLLPSMGYETLLERFAEEGHTTQNTMRLLNPHADWPNPPAGAVIRIPNVAGGGTKPPKAALVKVSLARRQVGVFDASGRQIALFPCSIAADKAKRPPSGEMRVKGIAPHPNYTYTSDRPDHRGRRRKYIYPSGPNNPVGSAWIGLSMPTYGIHGTPSPETVGSAESHGCFRLANWNAERLRDMVDEGCKVMVE